MAKNKITINRAAVLTLWAAVVAERLGHGKQEALTLGRAVAGLNAQSKGRRIGIYAEKTEEEKEKEKKEAKSSRLPMVDIMGRSVPVAKTPHGPRASRRKGRRSTRTAWRSILSRSLATSWEKPAPPSNISPGLTARMSWSCVHTTSTKSFARRSRKARRVGARRASSTWTISVRWRSERTCRSRRRRPVHNPISPYLFVVSHFLLFVDDLR